MQLRHMPRVDGGYWLAITAASLFGTNLGDLYAHESGLGIGLGLVILAVLAGLAFAAERRDMATRTLYYWLVIIIIRTGATNIADFLAYRVVGKAARASGNPIAMALSAAALALVLAGLLALFGWISTRRADPRESEAERTKGMPATGAAYWAAMLSAGVFGTVAGDICSHVTSEGFASIALALLLAGAVLLWRLYGARILMLYWLAVGVARTAGTAMGDWLAESRTVNIGLPAATAITGVAFVVILLLRARRREELVPSVS